MDEFQTNSGTVRAHGRGSWLIRLSAGSDPLTGKRCQPSKIFHGTRGDAQRELLKFQVECLDGWHRSDGLTIDELFRMWMESPAKGGRVRSASTKYNDEGRYRRYISPSLGARRADSLKAKDFTLLYDALLTRPFPGKAKPLSPRSVHHVHSLLRAMFTWAWKREYINENVVLRADSPSVSLSPPLAPERHLVASHLSPLWANHRELAAAVWIAATIGLRRSEIVALRWSDIDFDNNVIHIRHGITKTPGNEYVMNGTKTGLHGQAVFPLHPYTREVLLSMRQDWLVQLDAIGVSAIGDGFIISSDPAHTKSIHPDSLTKALNRHCSKCVDLEPITLQSLRRYAASDLAGTGADRSTASALLRNRPETTDRHYAAANSRLVRESALGLANRLLAEVS